MELDKKAQQPRDTQQRKQGNNAFQTFPNKDIKVWVIDTKLGSTCLGTNGYQRYSY